MTSLYNNIGGTRKSISSAFGNINAAQKQIFPYLAATPLSGLTVGSTVYMKVNGVSTAFIIVHQGRPSTAYDTSCDGTWLLMKDCYTQRAWDSTDNDYENSDIHSYLNNTFINLLDSGIRSIIKQVKLPYAEGITFYSGNAIIKTGADGISTKIFLLAFKEAGFAVNSSAYEGTILKYFSDHAEDDTNDYNICYYNGSAVNWWLRTQAGSNTKAEFVRSNGYGGSANVTISSYGVRPCLIAPSTALVDDSFNVIAA